MVSIYETHYFYHSQFTICESQSASDKVMHFLANAKCHMAKGKEKEIIKGKKYKKS